LPGIWRRAGWVHCRTWPLEGLTYFLVSLPDHPRQADIAALAGWLQSELADQD
jgi:hypothetical protein